MFHYYVLARLGCHNDVVHITVLYFYLGDLFLAPRTVKYGVFFNLEYSCYHEIE